MTNVEANENRIRARAISLRSWRICLMPAQPSLDPATLSRAQGCLLGQFTDIGWLRILDGRPIDLTATEAAEAGRAAASFQHRPGSQSALLSCHRAPGTYGCVGPRRSARWAARRPAFRHRPGSQTCRGGCRCRVQRTTSHSPSATEFRIVSRASGKLVLISPSTFLTPARPTWRP
jgi:hypothetical protein